MHPALRNDLDDGLLLAQQLLHDACLECGTVLLSHRGLVYHLLMRPPPLASYGELGWRLIVI